MSADGNPGAAPAADPSAAPLADVLVLDLSRVLAGPYCTQVLADLGARVIKVESPRGDDTRGWGPPFVPYRHAARDDAGPGREPPGGAGAAPGDTQRPGPGESAYFLSVNRGKQSVAVDLKDERGAALVRRLAARADVLVENFKVGDLARFGLDYASVSASNPGVVYASITGFGQTGPRAREPGYDAALQAATGVMAMTGEEGRPPVKLGVAWIDVLTGVHAATGVLAALHARARSGLGAHLDLSLFDVALASLVNQAQSALVTGEPPRRLGSAHPSIVPYQAFDAADAPLVIAVGNDEQFARLCRVLELPEVAADAGFRTNAGRVERRDALLPLLAERLRARPRAAWLEALRAAGVPATPVSTVVEALGDPQARARGVVLEAEHPALGRVPLVGSPFAHVAGPAAGPAAGAAPGVEAAPADASRPAPDGGVAPSQAGEPVPPPLLGQHTRAVLEGDLGLAPAEVEALLAAGVVRAW